MNIHSNFIGGNIIVIKQNENDVYLENEVRDSGEDWFYWAFCVEGAEGKEINFHIGPNRLGYWEHACFCTSYVRPVYYVQFREHPTKKAS